MSWQPTPFAATNHTNGADATPAGRDTAPAGPEATISRTETMTISATTNHGPIPTRENRTMNILQRFFGLGVRVRSHRAAKMVLQSKRLSTCGGLAIALAAGWFAVAQPAFGAYSGSGVFTKITSRTDLAVPGYYVVAYNTNVAMNCTNTAGSFTNY